MTPNRVVPLVGAPGARLTGTTLSRNLTDPTVQLASTMELYERFQPDVMLPFMDLTVEVEALGLDVNFPEDDNPSVRSHPVKTEEDLASLRRGWRGPSGRMRVYEQMIAGMRSRLPQEVGTFGYVIGPFTLAGELMGVSAAAEASIEQPELLGSMLDFSVDVIDDYAEMLFDAGADKVVVLEPTAVVLSPKGYDRFSRAPFQDLLKRLGEKPLILHICGDTRHLVKLMADSGAVGLSLDSQVSLPDIVGSVPVDVDIIGNVDPVSVLLDATPEEVEAVTADLARRMEGHGNFVLSSGCDLPLETPAENIEAFMRAGRRWKAGQS